VGTAELSYHCPLNPNPETIDGRAREPDSTCPQTL